MAQASAETTDMEDRLRRAEESRTWSLKLLSAFAHEISQPLTVIAGEIQLALLGAHPEAEYRKVLERCALQSRRSIKLVGQLRELRRAEGPVDANCSTGIVEVVRECADLIRPLADSKHVTLTSDARDDYTVAVPAETLRWTVCQILKFAVHRSPNGGEVSAGVTKLCGQVACRVSDRSPLPPPDELAHLLDPLTRNATQTLRFADSHLEWCLAKRAVQACGGTFDVAGGADACSVTLALPASTPHTQGD
jgi:signal transduction histidine kinase